MQKMAEDPLRSAIDAIRNRLHEELDLQLGQLNARHADELESARRSTEAEAEQRWSALAPKRTWPPRKRARLSISRLNVPASKSRQRLSGRDSKSRRLRNGPGLKSSSPRN